MKAIRIDEFGGREVMKIVEVKHPVPAADEILIKLDAASLNPANLSNASMANTLPTPGFQSVKAALVNPVKRM